jgi:hypothetical protein
MQQQAEWTYALVVLTALSFAFFIGTDGGIDNTGYFTLEDSDMEVISVEAPSIAASGSSVPVSVLILNNGIEATDVLTIRNLKTGEVLGSFSVTIGTGDVQTFTFFVALQGAGYHGIQASVGDSAVATTVEVYNDQPAFIE